MHNNTQKRKPEFSIDLLYNITEGISCYAKICSSSENEFHPVEIRCVNNVIDMVLFGSRETKPPFSEALKSIENEICKKQTELSPDICKTIKYSLWNYTQTYSCLAKITIDETTYDFKLTERIQGDIFIQVNNSHNNDKYKWKTLSEHRYFGDNSKFKPSLVELKKELSQSFAEHKKKQSEGQTTETVVADDALSIENIEKTDALEIDQKKSKSDSVSQQNISDEKTKFKRTKNAIGEKSGNCSPCTDCKECYRAPLLYYRNNQALRETYLIKENDKCYYLLKDATRYIRPLLWLGDISSLELDILTWINSLRYVSNEELTDLVESNIIKHQQIKFDKEKLNKKLSIMSAYGLIDEMKFVSLGTKDATKNAILLEGKPSEMKIYTLGDAGAKLLREVAREGKYNPFDRFQDGNIVKAILSANQWLIYWLYAFPNNFKNNNNYYPSRVIYLKKTLTSGARFHAAIKCKESLIVGAPLRRTSAEQEEQVKKALINKFERFMALFDDNNKDYLSSGFEEVAFPKEKIICYICEDLIHVNESYNILKDKLNEYPNQEVWFTTDLKTHNYNEEGQRFIVFNEKGEPEFVDLDKRFDLGKERADWERTEESTASETSTAEH